MDDIGTISPLLGTAAVIGVTRAIEKEAHVAGKAGRRKRKARKRVRA